jgi:2,4-dienoyl-CoA reductase-like NADH-dependent reductase (Old Yellow Enzyme family)
MLNIMREIQKAVPQMIIVGTGLSWFRDFAPNIAAGAIKDGWFKMAGFGRQAFAYPDFAKDIIFNGKMDRKKCCIACSKCTQIMRDKGRAGCVIKDSEVYLPIYLAGREGKDNAFGNNEAEHI